MRPSPVMSCAGAIVSAALDVAIAQLRQAEVEHLHEVARPHHHVGGFQVAMDDAVRVCRGDGAGHLRGDGEQAVERQAALRDHVGEHPAFDAFHRDEGLSAFRLGEAAIPATLAGLTYRMIWLPI